MIRKPILGEDGLMHCSVCGDALEAYINMPAFDETHGTYRKKVRCICSCESKEYEEAEKKREYREKQDRINEIKRLSLIDSKFKDASLGSYKITKDNQKAFNIARKYVDNFDTMIKNGQGLMFWGEVGTGKSYTAAAIANELMQKMKPVMMTSLSKILAETGNFKSENAELLAKLNASELLVIDDFGTERSTDFALEKVYGVIDARYRIKKPLIITTNVTLEEMKTCQDIRYRRIYDRIFAMCYPVMMNGMSWRKKEAANNYEGTKRLLEG